jgi:hypothetical protein
VREILTNGVENLKKVRGWRDFVFLNAQEEL